MLESFGYKVVVAENGREAFNLIRTGRYRLVVSDWEMPEMSGVEFCREIRGRSWSSYIYVILVTSYDKVENLVEGLDAGADDFLTKPIQPEELRVRLRTGERILARESRDMVIFAMARLVESRSPETGTHLERMREYCRIIGEELSHWEKYKQEIDGEYVELLYLTSPLHDIGKVGIPDNVLLKPGKLTPEEFEIMKEHTLIGGKTLSAAARVYPEVQMLSMACEIAMTHHERWDGTGYPHGLKGLDIPLSGRITALADVYDALTSKRVYKDSISHEEARKIILEGRGTHFDPDVVDAFLLREQDFIDVADRIQETPESEEAEITCSSQTAPAH
jgi:putative two-component system response regulator